MRSKWTMHAGRNGGLSYMCITIKWCGAVCLNLCTLCKWRGRGGRRSGRGNGGGREISISRNSWGIITQLFAKRKDRQSTHESFWAADCACPGLRMPQAGYVSPGCLEFSPAPQMGLEDRLLLVFHFLYYLIKNKRAPVLTIKTLVVLTKGDWLKALSSGVVTMLPPTKYSWEVHA